MKLNKNSSANIKYLRKKNKTCWSGLYDTSDTKSLRKVHEWSRKLRAMQLRAQWFPPSMSATTIASPFHTTRWGSHESPLIRTLIIGPDNARCHNTQTIARGRLKNQRIKGLPGIFSSWGRGEGGLAGSNEKDKDNGNEQFPRDPIWSNKIFIRFPPTRTKSFGT